MKYFDNNYLIKFYAVIAPIILSDPIKNLETSKWSIIIIFIMT